MPATLHGELTADNSHIVLIGVGDDYDLDRMSKTLRKMTPLMKASDPPGALLCPCSWPAVIQLAFTFTGNGNGWWVPSPRLKEWSQAEFARRTARQPLSVVPPDGLVPRPYQIEGAEEIAATGRFLCCDEPGTGKTITTILGLRELGLRGETVFPAVVVVPSWDVARGWLREIARWMPHWRAALWGGPDRMALLQRDGVSPGTDIYITTYATARRDAADMRGPLVKLRPAAAVADECHFLKSPTAKQSLAFGRIASHARAVIELSGTPITRDTGDLFPALNAMEPAAWAAKDRFVKWYCDRTEDDYGETIDGLNQLREPEFRAALTGSYRRVAKADVLDQLPPKIHTVREVDLPPEWRKTYDGMEADMLAELPDGQELPAMDVLAKMSHLAQMAAAAFDVDITEEPDEQTGLMKKHYHVILKAPSWKADVLLEILAERKGQPVVCFAPSRQLIMVAGKLAEDAGLRVGYIVGVGNGITQKTRAKAIADLDAGKLDLLAVTTQAGGTGLNLTAAGTAVFLGRPWPLADAIQAEDRIHRIGSEIHPHGVEIIDIVARDTVDSRVRERLREKGSQLADFVRDPRVVKELLGGLK